MEDQCLLCGKETIKRDRRVHYGSTDPPSPLITTLRWLYSKKADEMEMALPDMLYGEFYLCRKCNHTSNSFSEKAAIFLTEIEKVIRNRAATDYIIPQPNSPTSSTPIGGKRPSSQSNSSTSKRPRVIRGGVNAAVQVRLILSYCI